MSQSWSWSLREPTLNLRAGGDFSEAITILERVISPEAVIYLEGVIFLEGVISLEGVMVV